MPTREQRQDRPDSALRPRQQVPQSALPQDAVAPPRERGAFRWLDRSSVLRLQRAAGNATVNRLMRARLQRQGPEGQRRRPSLLGDQGLTLDPEIMLQMQAMDALRGSLTADALRPNLLQVPADAVAAPGPMDAPATPAAEPLVPAGEGPAEPRAAEGGDLLRAVMAVPAVDQAINRLRDQALEQVQRDWRALGPEGRPLVVTSLAVVGGGALAGAATDPQARDFLLGQLNGRVLPVPGVSGLGVELNTAGDNVMLGFHLDVGRFLPDSLGFGPGSPTAIGAPPPISRSVDEPARAEEAEHVSASLAVSDPPRLQRQTATPVSHGPQTLVPHTLDSDGPAMEPGVTDEAAPAPAMADGPRLAPPGAPPAGGPGDPPPALTGLSGLVQRSEGSEGEDDKPTEEEKKQALRMAEAAEAQATQAADKNQNDVSRVNSAKQAEKQKQEAAKQEQTAAKKGGEEGARKGEKPAKEKKAEKEEGAAKVKAAKPEVEAGGKGAAAGAGDAGAMLEEAPRSPEEDPDFLAMQDTAKKAAATEKQHPPGAKTAGEAQEASEPPESEVTSKAQSKQAAKIESAPAPGFDKAAFKAKLMERIQQSAPKTMQEADNFKNSGKMNAVKGELGAEVEGQKEASTGPTEEEKDAEPDTASVEPKPVTPLQEKDPGAKPAIPDVEKAVPKPKGKAELEAPLKDEARSADREMKEADVTDDQLAKSNEPEFQSALEAKKEAKQHAVEDPKQYRQDEKGQIASAEEEARQTGDVKLEEMHGDKAGALKLIGGDQARTKSEDEKKRAEVAAKINSIYEKTRGKVESILSGLDAEVTAAFDSGAEAARQAFESYVDARMNAYKQRRYGGWFGWARWAKDKLLGMPGEVNAFYTEGRAQYLAAMDAVIDRVVTIIATRLTEAKAAIATGRQEIDDYVAKLPKDLQQVGRDAAEEMDGKFENLEQSVDAKQDDLVNTLAQKYNEQLSALDARIEELKAANKGFVQRAVDAVKGVIKTILQLKDMLFNVLASAAGLIGKIIKDPIGFLGNLLGAVKSGFENFVGKIGHYLKEGLMKWLFGALGAAGLALPKVFDIRGILSLVMQVLGLTWDFIRGIAVKALGEKVVSHLEKAFDIFVTIKEKGLEGLWDFIQDKIGDLKDMVMGQIEDMVITQVIKAGVQWLIGLLGGPAGAFIKAAKAIYDIVVWFLNNGKQVLSLVQSIINSIGKIASGNIGAAASAIEQSLGKAVPVVIGFLASLLGLGNISEKVRGIIQTVRRPVEKAIGWVIGKAKAFALKIMGAITGKGKEKDKSAEPEFMQDVKKAVGDASKKRYNSQAEADAALDSIEKQFKPKGLKSLDLADKPSEGTTYAVIARAAAGGLRVIPKGPFTLLSVDTSKKLASGGDPGSIASPWAPGGVPEPYRSQSGVYAGQVRDEDSKQVFKAVVKCFPPTHVGNARQQIQSGLNAQRAGGPLMFGQVPPPFPGMFAIAMEFVEGGFPVAEPTSGYDPAQAAQEAAGHAARVSNKTVQSLRAYYKNLVRTGFYVSGEVQGFIQPDGTWKAIDPSGVEPLPSDKTSQAFKDALKTHKGNFTAEFHRLRSLASKNKAAGVQTP